MQQAEIGETIRGDQDYIGMIGLQEILQRGHLQIDGGNLEVTAGFQRPGQELRLDSPGIGDENVHDFCREGQRGRRLFSGAEVIHTLSINHVAIAVCSHRHTLLVMNPAAAFYFRRAPLVHNFYGSSLSARAGEAL